MRRSGTRKLFARCADAVYREHDALAGRGVFGRGRVEEELHHLGREPWQHQPEDAPRPRWTAA